MTTNHHTAISTGAAANAATINSPLAELDAAINDRVVLPARVFGIVNGTPGEGELGASSGVHEVMTWLFDDAAYEYVGAGVPVPTLKSGSTIHIDIFWAMESATSGVVRVSVSLSAIADGEGFGAAGTNNNSDVSVPGTAKIVKKTTFSLSVSYVAGDILRLRFGRGGPDGPDTATGDLHFIGAMVRFA